MNRRRQGVALALLAVLVLLGTLAHGSPPDPTWIGGLWDDADFADAVNLVTSALSTVESLFLSEVRPSWWYVSQRSPRRRGPARSGSAHPTAALPR